MATGYAGWKQLSKVNIIYSNDDYIEYNNKKYKKAYITEAGTTKACQNALESGKHWAAGWSSKAKAPTIIETDNVGFNFQIVSAAGNSYSQGGKLSFWVCIMDKEGVEPFSVGINSDLLADLILESNIYKGAVKEKVFFARKNSQLGVLHEAMPSYQALLNDQKIKNDLSKNKTSKWRIGYSYSTPTKTDVYLGLFRNPCIKINYVYGGYGCRNTYINTLDFDAKAKHLYDSPVYKNEKFNFIETIEWPLRFSRYTYNTCPSRKEDAQIFVASDNYYQDVCDTAIKIAKNIKVSCHEHIEELAFKVFYINPDVTIKILEQEIDKVTKYIDEIRSENRYEPNEVLYNSKGIEFIIDYGNQRFKFYNDIIGYYNKLIEIAKQERQARGI